MPSVIRSVYLIHRYPKKRWQQPRVKTCFFGGIYEAIKPRRQDPAYTNRKAKADHSRGLPGYYVRNFKTIILLQGTVSNYFTRSCLRIKILYNRILNKSKNNKKLTVPMYRKLFVYSVHDSWLCTFKNSNQEYPFFFCIPFNFLLLLFFFKYRIQKIIEIDTQKSPKKIFFYSFMVFAIIDRGLRSAVRDLRIPRLKDKRDFRGFIGTDRLIEIKRSLPLSLFLSRPQACFEKLSASCLPRRSWWVRNLNTARLAIPGIPVARVPPRSSSPGFYPSDLYSSSKSVNTHASGSRSRSYKRVHLSLCPLYTSSLINSNFRW